jgi:hypothetical protein
VNSRKDPRTRGDEPEIEEITAPAAPAPYAQLRVLASAVGNQVFTQRIVARDGRQPGFGSGAPAKVEPPPRPAGKAGFGDKPHAVDPKDHKEEPPEPALPQSPYGKLPFPAPRGVPNWSSLNYFTKKSLESDAAVRAEHAALKQHMASGETPASDFYAKNEKTYEGEMGANQTKDAKEEAEDLVQQRTIIELADTQIGMIKSDLDEARSKLESANLKLGSLADLADARSLAAKAKAVEEAAEEAFEELNLAVDLAKAVVTFNPVEAAKSLYDALGKAVAVKLTAAEELKSEAEAKRRSGDNKALQAVWVDIDAATKKIDDLAKLAGPAQATAATGVRDFARMRTEAESEYDSTTKGAFKFGTLGKHLAWATAAGPQAEKLARRFEEALVISRALKDNYDQAINQTIMDDKDPAESRAALITATAMVAGQEAGLADAKSSRARADKLLAQLTGLRDKADRRMAEAPVPARKRAAMRSR